MGDCVKAAGAMLKRIAVANVALGLVGCGGGAASQVILEHPFPDKAKLQEMASAPPPSTDKAVDSVGLAVDTWKLAGPFPTTASSTPYAGDDALARAVAKQVQASKRPFVLTESMQCYAREIGRFFTLHRKLPQLDLQAFMAGRCGVVPNAPLAFYLTSSGPAPVDAAAKELEKGLAKISGPQELGVWTGGSDKGQVVMAVYGAPKVKLTAVKVAKEGTPTLRVQGRLVDATGWLQGHASIGALGASTCTPTPRSAAVLPDFDLQCTLSKDDAYATFDMIAGAPNALLGQGVLSLVVPVNGEAPANYTSVAVTGAQNAKEGLLNQINAVRASLKRANLEEVPQQSRTANVLVPHFFSAMADENQQKLDLISLGLIAGWDVPGPIRDAHLVSFRGTRGDSAPTFLSELLFFPSNRSVLLDPDARRVAVATMKDGKGEAVLGLITTYSIFEPRNYGSIESDLMDELDRQRQARGKKPIERVGGEETDRVLDPIMAKLTRGEMTPSGGLQEVLQTYSSRVRREFQGMVYATMVIDGWRPKFEGPLLDLEGVAVTAKIGFFVGQGANWGQYVTYFVFMSTGDQLRARAEPRGEVAER